MGKNICIRCFLVRKMKMGHQWLKSSFFIILMLVLMNFITVSFFVNVGFYR